MREDKALALVEQKWGSLEEFGWDLLTECPEVLDDDYDLLAVGQKLGIDAAPLGRILRGTAFRSMMTRLAVAREYSFNDEIAHVRTIRADAVNEKKNTDTRIKARQHLAVLEGKPLQTSTGGGNQGLVLQINFGTAGAQPAVAGDERTIDVEVHKPARAGDLPPEGARRRFAEEPTDGRTVHGVAVASDLDLYSDESSYTTKKADGETTPGFGEEKN